jgi:uncharacterized protein (TIGR03067 family)
MRRRALLVAVAVGLLIAADKKDDAKGDQDKIQGTWVCVSAERGGQALPDEAGKEFKFTFKGDKLTLHMRDQKKEGTFKLDPTKKPKTITIKPSGEDKELRGVYMFDGETLKLCAGEPGEDPPKDFTTKDGGRLMLFVLKRSKP